MSDKAKMGKAAVYGEPWKRISGMGVIRDRNQYDHAKPVTIKSSDRIVACVNACAGMDDPDTEIGSLQARHPAKREDVEALIEACEQVLIWDKYGTATAAIEVALARVKGADDD